MRMNLFTRKPDRDACYTSLRSAVTSGATTTIRDLLASHPDLLNQRDEKGMTPLLWAAECQNLSSVACLVDLGADTEAKDDLGYDAVMLAQWHGEYRMRAYTDVSLKIVDRIRAAK